ncbi:hypothetical protein FXF51_18125 [Nonomuraea sp. PA05]|uniref:hypothetical protein n=1 Tax=Nonomuraea sp. PA05 TaxID=2604466 RepID=UPI0011DA41E3|nr:hypothetical protein [Nonomuraea sp. PA05]TYB66111.1 hypothetical protein FXF51_18125 [Nonomuraea sp. PA05]
MNEDVAADEECPAGNGPRGLDCRKADPGYKAAPIFDACMKQHQVKTADIMCHRALIVWFECTAGEQSNAVTPRMCDTSAGSYLSCRTGTPARSDQVCAAGEREYLRCPGSYGDPFVDCGDLRRSYYECRDDRSGSDPFCGTYLEVLSVCRSLKVECADLLGKFLTCAAAELSPDECAFGQRMRIYCLRDVNDGVFRSAATCDAPWRQAMTECLDEDQPAPLCTMGASWREASYSICEGRRGVAYLTGRATDTPICWTGHHAAELTNEVMEGLGEDTYVRVVHVDGDLSYEVMPRRDQETS